MSENAIRLLGALAGLAFCAVVVHLAGWDGLLRIARW